MENPNLLVQLIKVETYGASAQALGSVKAVGVPELKPVITTGADPSSGKQRFVELKTKYHIFPSFPDPNVASDIANNELMPLLDPQYKNRVELSIQYGGDPLNTGLFLIIPTPNGDPKRINLGIYLYEREVNGAEVTRSAFIKSLEGTGVL